MEFKDNNELWFVNETEYLKDYSEGYLSEQIFSLVNSRISDNQIEIMRNIIDAVPAVEELKKGLQKSWRLKLVFSDEIKDKLSDGTYRLMKRKDANGIFKAIVVDENGQARGIADLKWEEVCKGIDPAKLSTAMQGVAIQQQLREISEKLEDMSSAIEKVVMGQHNDRLALFYEGEALYREALAVKDIEKKKQLSSLAIMSLTNAISSLQINLISDVNEIVEKYDATKGRFVGIKSEAIRDKMFIINSSFQAIHKAVTLKTAIYYYEDEYTASVAILNDYKSFLERLLTEEKTKILYFADPKEKEIEGNWNMRKNELPQKIDKTKELLDSPQNYSLEVKEEDVG